MGLGGWGRENATVSRINHGTRGVGGGGRENTTVSRVNQRLGRGKERECHSEHSNP